MNWDFEKVLDEYGDYLLRVAYFYVKNRTSAEDIVQDVFVRFYRKQDQFEERASLKTYLVKMTVNGSYDYLRSWKRKREIFFEKIHSRTTNHTPELSMIEATEKMRVTEAILQLSIPYREVIVLYYYQEFNTVEIAEIIGCPESTVRTRLQRARKVLHDQLADYEWEGLLHE